MVAKHPGFGIGLPGLNTSAKSLIKQHCASVSLRKSDLFDKGVGRIDSCKEAHDALTYAMSFSREKRLIVEEYVDMFGYQVAGDGLSVDGKLVFRYFANDHFNPACVNPFVPISASFPYNMPSNVHDKIHDEIMGKKIQV